MFVANLGTGPTWMPNDAQPCESFKYLAALEDSAEWARFSAIKRAEITAAKKDFAVKCNATALSPAEAALIPRGPFGYVPWVLGAGGVVALAVGKKPLGVGLLGGGLLAWVLTNTIVGAYVSELVQKVTGPRAAQQT